MSDKFLTYTARALTWGIVTMVAGLVGIGLAAAHFSYSDPRIIHLAPEDGGAVALIRLPGPLALLPDDWQGQAETRLPPFAADLDGDTVLDRDAVAKDRAALMARLADALTLEVDGRSVRAEVQAVRFWSDDGRPSFGTLASARKAFARPEGAVDPLGYYDLTLDLRVVLPGVDPTRDVRVVSDLGRNFEVMDRFGTVLKLHRETIETRAVLGVVDVTFPASATVWDRLRVAALSGAEHIWRGADHLAMILLIAIAAPGWRVAMSWASAFTVGHMVTLIAGLYGVAPAAGWFVPLVELSIAGSIVVAGLAVALRRSHRLGHGGLLAVGLIHGYGFAASASEALFAGPIDGVELTAFALGLEAAQLSIYGLALPLILLADRGLGKAALPWRRAVAVSIAAAACMATVLRLGAIGGAIGIA